MEALVYDVHGNLPALEAVLDDAREGTRFVLGGDYALFGGFCHGSPISDVRSFLPEPADHEASAAKVRAQNTEWAEVIARRIEHARADV
jgi:hypothetical protein